MPLRAVPVCFLHFAEGFRLNFSHICGTTDQTTTRPSGSRPLALSLDSPRQTSITGRSTDPVGGKTVEVQKTEREEQRTKDQKPEDQKTENGSKARGDVGLNLASNPEGGEGPVVGEVQEGEGTHGDQAGSSCCGYKCSCVIM